MARIRAVSNFSFGEVIFFNIRTDSQVYQMLRRRLLTFLYVLKAAL